MTTTQTTDAAHAQEAVDALLEAANQLYRVHEQMTELPADTGIRTAPQIASLVRSAFDQAQSALLLARNELKLAERDAR